MLGVLVVVQVAVVRVKLLIRTYTVGGVLTRFLLTAVVGVLGEDFLRGHLQLLKEELG